MLRPCLRACAAWLIAGTVLPAAAAEAAPPVVIRYALWDANQRPMYAQCARDFEAANPGIRIRLEQVGWDDYWTALATGFISNTAPDVFTNHVAKFSEFVLNGVVADLAPRVARDKVPVDIYEDGLLPMWQHQGRLYALPTDWDTVALAVNMTMARQAGLSLEALRKLDWNPRDGGSFARAVARLSVDEQGRRGDEPGFDPKRVRTYGFQLPGGSGMMGQSQWSGFVASTGWRYQAAPWDPALRYDDPRFIDTIEWFASLPGRGWSAAPDRMGRLGAVAMFFSGLVAMVPEGSWMVGHYNRHARIDYAWIPMPIGPSGQRSTMRNSLALSVWSGTRHPEQAWAWVRHVGSRACQERTAQAGVVYPAIKGLGEVALAVQNRSGRDASVFVEAARGDTFLPPIAPRAAEITDLMNATLERVLAGRANAGEALRDLGPRVRALASQP